MSNGHTPKSDLTTPDLLFRTPTVKSGRRRYTSGETIIRPDQKVEALYRLHRGRIDMVRNLGTPKESRKTFERESDGSWSPILGGRYFFIDKPSSRHYIVTKDSEVDVLNRDSLRRLYLSTGGEILLLVRELIRCSDMDIEDAKLELAVRYATTDASGFLYEENQLEGLLRHSRDDRHTKDPDHLAFIEEQYIAFAQSMLLRWCGPWIDPGKNADGKSLTNVQLEPFNPLSP